VLVGLVTAEYAGVTHYTGGIGTQFRAMAEAMAAAGDTVKVLIVDGVATDAGETPAGIAFRFGEPLGFRLPTALEPLRYPLIARSCAAWLDDCDVVIAPEYGAWTVLARGRGKRHVTNLATSLEQVRAVEPVPDQSRSRRWADRLQFRLERRQARRADAIMACSESLLAWTRRLWDIDGVPAEVVPNFLPDAEIQNRSSSDRAAGCTVLFTGRVCEWKGADVLIDALVACWRKDPAIRLELMGRIDRIGGEPADQAILGRAGDRRGQVALRGHASRDEVLRAAGGADIAVFPSRFEAFGLGALEAMRAGAAVIATRGSGFEMFCRDEVNCLLVEPGDTAALAHAISTLDADPALRVRLATAGVNTASRFTSAHVTPVLRSFLDRVVQSPRR
jgi:glycogen synthase